VKALIKAAKISARVANEAVNRFCGEQHSFLDDEKCKEDVIGGGVELYHRLFNLEDRFDHLVSNSTPQISCQKKDSRILETVLLTVLINAYALHVEVSAKTKHSEREGIDDWQRKFARSDFLATLVREMME